jgi:hypothetical protein
MESKTKIIVFGAAIVVGAAATLWWLKSSKRNGSLRPSRATVPSALPTSALTGNINSISKLKKLYEEFEKDSAEDWFRSFEPQSTDGLNVLLYGNLFYWSVFYKNAWIKIDAFCNYEIGADVFHRGPPRCEWDLTAQLLLPVDVPIHFYVFKSGIPALQTFQLQDSTTEAALTTSEPSEPFHFSCTLKSVGQNVFSKTLVELRQGDAARRERQLKTEPAFHDNPEAGATRILDVNDPKHANAIKLAKELQSVVVIGATFKVVSQPEFSKWLAENQSEQLEST